MNHFFKLLFAVTLLLLITNSCEESDPTIISDRPLANVPEFVEHDYLHFATFDSYEKYISEKIELSQKGLKAHDEGLGFTSMRSLFLEASEDEIEFRNALGHVDGNLRDYSTIVRENLNRFSFNQEGDIQLNTFWADASVALNIDGFVRIGDVLYKYARDTVKAMAINTPQELEERHRLFSISTIGLNENGVAVSLVENSFSTTGARTSYDDSCVKITQLGDIMTGGATFTNTPNWASVWDAGCGCLKLYIKSYLAVLNVSLSVTTGSFPSVEKSISGTYQRNGQSQQSFSFTGTGYGDMERTAYSVVNISVLPPNHASAVDLSDFSGSYIVSYVGVGLQQQCTLGFSD